MKHLLFLAIAVFSSACVTHQTKLDEAAAVNSGARAKGYASTPLEAATRARAECVPSTTLKWESKLDSKSPMIRQADEGKESFGYYDVLCFTAPETGERTVQVATVHQGGGFSKAFFVLPFVYVFSSAQLKPVELGKRSAFVQQPLSGDYLATFPLKMTKGEKYFVVVESDNRHPDLSWTEYPNMGLGFMLRAAIPVRVYSSIGGRVKTEILDPSRVSKK